MSTLSFVDSAYASAITGGPYDGVCFYIGGDAFHVWSTAELATRHEKYRLPIWVRSNPQSVDPTADAHACLAALNSYAVSAGALVALDSETSVDAPWVHTFVTVVNSGGYPVIDYGSASTVFGNANPDGYYWAADWTGTPHFANGSQMTQYVSFNNDDVSVAQPSLPFWGMTLSGTQFGWRRCTKCQCLMWPVDGLAPCAAGGVHNPEPTTNWGVPYRKG